jgi:hypothetical protein
MNFIKFDMNLDIDVSGEDILNKDYSICIANNDGTIKGFKFSKELTKILGAKHGQNLYRYGTSKKQKATFKVRLYTIIIYYLIKQIKNKQIHLTICKDFSRREHDIKSNLDYFLKNILKKEITYEFRKLDKNSNAHHYSYLMRKDTKNKFNNYIKISLEEIEKFLK